MEDTMITNLKVKTGKSLEQWIAIVKSQKLEKHSAILQFLKTEHGFTHGFANLVALKTLKSDAGSVEDTEELVAAQYSGGKEALRPVYDKLIAELKQFGDDVELAPKKAYVSVRRKKQFAIVQPSTKTRLDVGINLKDHSAEERLEISGSFNSMVSHRVRLGSVEDVDQKLIAWLRQAYEQAG